MKPKRRPLYKRWRNPLLVTPWWVFLKPEWLNRKQSQVNFHYDRITFIIKFQTWFLLWKKPILFEPPSKLIQAETIQFVRPEWYPPTYNPINWKIREAIKADKVEAYFDQNVIKQQSFRGKLTSLPPESKGNGKPYRGPNWAEVIEDEEPRPELAIDPRDWQIPRMFNSVVQDNHFRTHERKKQPERQNRRFYLEEQGADDKNYLPFYFYSWYEMPCLSVQDRAAIEQPEDGMVISEEILKGEWD